MQVANVKQVAKAALANMAVNQAIIQKAEDDKAKVSNSKTSSVAELTKSQSFNRFLEAYSDCV